MDHFLRELRGLFTEEELFSIARSLHDSYHPFIPESEVWTLLKFALPESIYASIAKQSDSIVGHQLVNLIIMNFYPGERVVKYYLARERIAARNEVTAFEIKVNNSRLDVGRINGKSYAFEIKTELDSLTKLPKQLVDYSEVFEYVTVVAHESHYEKLLSSVPEHCGLRVYSLAKGKYRFNNFRKPLPSPLLSAKSQINCLSSRELAFVLKSFGYDKSLQTREEREEAIYTHIPERRINAFVKKALKYRFTDKWSFVLRHFRDIYPVDLQAFFSSSADPFWVYYKNSSIVDK